MLSLLVFPILYFILLTCLVWHWLRPGRHKNDGRKEPRSLSVIIPFRNEAKNMERLLAGIAEQGSPDGVEYIFVDDHSRDGGAEKLREVIRAYPKLLWKLISLNGTKKGKKAALRKGVSASAGDILAFTDADAMIPPGWIQGIMSVFSREGNLQLLCGPVSIDYSSGFLNAFQALEYGNLMLSGTAALNVGFPLLASGANMAIRKSALNRLGDDPWRDSISSGDDVYLLHSVFRVFGKGAVRFSQDPELLVRAQPAPGWGEFFAQRLRWAGKTVSSGSGSAYLIGFLVVFTNLIVVLSIFFAVYGAPDWAVVFGIWGIKALGESLTALVWARFSGQVKALKWLPLMTLVYPFIHLAVFCSSLFIKPIWKGRKVVNTS